MKVIIVHSDYNSAKVYRIFATKQTHAAQQGWMKAVKSLDNTAEFCAVDNGVFEVTSMQDVTPAFTRDNGISKWIKL